MCANLVNTFTSLQMWTVVEINFGDTLKDNVIFQSSATSNHWYTLEK